MILYCSACGCSSANADIAIFCGLNELRDVVTRADCSAKMVICSDHFFDECYENSAFLKSKLMPLEKKGCEYHQYQMPCLILTSSLRNFGSLYS